MGFEMDKSTEAEIKEKTRKIYENQHDYVRNDEIAMKRFISMYESDYFKPAGINKSFLSGAKILEIGCGNTGKTAIGLYQLAGTSLDYTFTDLGENWINSMKSSLSKYDFDNSCSKFTSASADELPFDDKIFDLVVCHGVLLHVPSLNCAEKSVQEICRVTKDSGKIYAVGGVVGGIYEEAIFPAIRSFYNSNKSFKKFIDDINQESIETIKNQFINEVNILQVDSPLADLISTGGFTKLFDTDLFVTLQNIIQAPVRLELSEEWWKQNFSNEGFNRITRLFRRVERENIRGIFQELHFLNAKNKACSDYKLPTELSNFLDSVYGSGNLEYVFTKSNK
ncbi:class I SAM-dependent methyltransferase [Synechococcus sp. AH-601-N10]|nr:class I SAM-dependent methyltransferase [Synechococcus sp. AH-601-N10]